VLRSYPLRLALRPAWRLRHSKRLTKR
jgi:hypothetical protein